MDAEARKAAIERFRHSGKKMGIPDRVKIGPYWWTVEIVAELWDDANRNARLFGQCREGEQKIIINGSLNPDGYFATFMHELAHAINFVMMAGLREKQIDRMATGLATVLIDNDLWHWEGEATDAPHPQVDADPRLAALDGA